MSASSAACAVSSRGSVSSSSAEPVITNGKVVTLSCSARASACSTDWFAARCFAEAGGARAPRAGEPP